MGKSLGNVLDPKLLVGTYGSNAVRFFFMREIAFGSDGDFSEARFQATVNASLANDVGNLLSRTLSMLYKNVTPLEEKFGGGVRLPLGAAEARAATKLAEAAERQVATAREAYETMRIHQVCEAALGLSAEANMFLSELQPWHTFKQARDSNC